MYADKVDTIKQTAMVHQKIYLVCVLCLVYFGSHAVLDSTFLSFITICFVSEYHLSTTDYLIFSSNILSF